MVPFPVDPARSGAVDGCAAIPSDTTCDSAQAQLRLLREKSPSERLALAARLSSDIIHAAKRAIARVHPGFSQSEVALRFIQLHYGHDLAHALAETGSGPRMDGASELLQALGPVLTELTRLGVRYYVGGSVASSIHGAARSTLDVDVAAVLDEPQGLQLVEALQDKYYISKEAALSAVRRRSCFNLIHLATSFKIDVFVCKDRAFDRSVLDRAAVQALGEVDSILAHVATAEDIILLKLEWYRLGNEASERQWNDLTQVTKLHGEQLDHEYLRHWAKDLGVADLLDRLALELEQGNG